MAPRWSTRLFFMEADIAQKSLLILKCSLGPVNSLKKSFPGAEEKPSGDKMLVHKHEGLAKNEGWREWLCTREDLTSDPDMEGQAWLHPRL